MERNQELESLLEALRVATEQSAQLAIVCGSSGSGKSFLAEHFIRTARNEFPNLVCSAARGSSLFGSEAGYQGIKQILRTSIGAHSSYLKQNDEGKNALHTGMVDLGRRLFQHSPELIKQILLTVPPNYLAGIFADHSEQDAALKRLRSAKSLDSRSDIFAKIVNVYSEMSHPMIIFVDDAQWIDPVSIEIIMTMLRELEAEPILVLFSISTEDTHTQISGLGLSVFDIARSQEDPSRVRTIDLDSVQRSRGREFCAAALQDSCLSCTESDIEKLLELTSGNPLVVCDVLELIVNNLEPKKSIANIDDLQIDWSELPREHRDTFQKKLDSVSRRSRRILETAATEGATFTAEVIADIHGLDMLDLLEILDVELRQKASLVCDFSEIDQTHLNGPEATKFAFAHGAYRTFIYETIAPSRRRELHKRIATVIEKRRLNIGLEDLVKYAYHLNQGAEFSKAISTYIEISKSGENQFDYRTAHSASKRAIELFSKFEGVKPLTEEIKELFYIAAKSSRRLGLFGQAENYSRELLERMPVAKNKKLSIHVRSELASALYNQDRDFGHAERCLVGALKTAKSLKGLSIDMQINLRRQLGIARQRGGKFESALLEMKDALVTLSPKGSASANADLINSIALLFGLLGDFQFSTQCHLIALKLVMDAEDSSRNSLFLNDMTASFRRMSDLRNAKNSSAMAETLAESQGKSGAVARAIFEQAQNMKYSGDVDGYKKGLHSVLRFGPVLRWQGPTIARTIFEMGILDTKLLDGDYARDIAQIKSKKHFRNLSATNELFAPSLFYAASLVEKGDYVGAASMFEQLISVTNRGVELSSWWWELIRLLAKIGLEQCAQHSVEVQTTVRTVAHNSIEAFIIRYGQGIAPEVTSFYKLWVQKMGIQATPLEGLTIQRKENETIKLLRDEIQQFLQELFPTSLDISLDKLISIH